MRSARCADYPRRVVVNQSFPETISVSAQRRDLAAGKTVGADPALSSGHKPAQRRAARCQDHRTAMLVAIPVSFSQHQQVICSFWSSARRRPARRSRVLRSPVMTVSGLPSPIRFSQFALLLAKIEIALLTQRPAGHRSSLCRMHALPDREVQSKISWRKGDQILSYRFSRATLRLIPGTQFESSQPHHALSRYRRFPDGRRIARIEEPRPGSSCDEQQRPGGGACRERDRPLARCRGVPRPSAAIRRRRPGWPQGRPW